MNKNEECLNKCVEGVVKTIYPMFKEWEKDFPLRIAVMKMANKKPIIDLREYKR